MAKTYDFGGYATRNNLRCADGRTIRQDAFKDCDGQTVPLVWQHMHDDPTNVLGHATLENRSDGVYCYCSFNGSQSGQQAKEIVKHGDVQALSIYANRLQQRGHDVVHGVIREVSLVLAGANPGAYIDNLSFAHGDGSYDTLEDEATIKLVEYDNIMIAHSDGDGGEGEGEGSAPQPSSDDDSNDGDDGKGIMDLFDEAVQGLDEKHQQAVYAVIGALAEDDDDDDEPEPKQRRRASEDDEDDDDDDEDLSHADGPTIQEIVESLDDEEADVVEAVVKAATKGGDVTKEQAQAFQAMSKEKQDATYALVGAILQNEGKSDDDEGDDDDLEHYDYEGETMKYNVFDAETGEGISLSHADMQGVFDDAKVLGSLKDAVLAHGIQNIEVLFPEAQAVNQTPYPIARRMEWVSKVLGSTHKTPFARIKSTAANLTADEARARGYIKGKKKIEEQISALKRVTTPQTIYKLQKLDRDDIVDITDFDVVAWMKEEMRMMLDEELARAILIGDGRFSGAEDKIQPTNIRPIWTDEATYVINSVLVTGGMSAEQRAREFVDTVIRSRKNYKGSGTPTMFIGPDLLVELRLLKDGDGYRRYKTDNELAEDLRLKEIVEVELFDDQERTVEGQQRTLGAIIVNMSDYTCGANKGGEVTLFDNFDLNYNKYEYLIETRMCGALTMPFSAIVVEFTDGPVAGHTYSVAATIDDDAEDMDVEPQSNGWYEKVNGAYILSQDEYGQPGKTYYKQD